MAIVYRASLDVVLAYQQPLSSQTLREGLAEYRDAHDGLVVGRGLSEAAREFFRCHDVAHVVFGCSTSLTNEAMVKIWSFFGTTAGLGLLRAYRLPESQEIYAEIPARAVPGTALRSLVLVPRVLAGCLRMTERWPWSDHDAYLDAPLCELRGRYGIEVVTAP